jgi:hypothetical protein
LDIHLSSLPLHGLPEINILSYAKRIHQLMLRRLKLICGETKGTVEGIPKALHQCLENGKFVETPGA